MLRIRFQIAWYTASRLFGQPIGLGGAERIAKLIDLTREAWIRQLKRLSQQCWKVSTEFKLPDSLKMQEHTMSTMMLLGMTFVDPVATIAGRQIRISETQ